MDKLNEVIEKEMRGIYNGIFPLLAKEIISAIIEDRKDKLSKCIHLWEDDLDDVKKGSVAGAKLILDNEIKELQEAMEKLK